MAKLSYLAFTALLTSTLAGGNPYFDETKVPKDTLPLVDHGRAGTPLKFLQGADVVRVDLTWNEASDTFIFAGAHIEASGTDAFTARARHEDPLGSYKGRLVDLKTGVAIAHDALGTGKEFRRLSRGLSFRFPKPSESVNFELVAEDPLSGTMDHVLTEPIDVSALERFAYEPSQNFEARTIAEAQAPPSLIVAIYAEGYQAADKERFFSDAARVAQTFSNQALPRLAQLEIRAVFETSAESLGRARDLGLPVPVRDSFLSLFFPYWNNFGRWYHVIYPTDFRKYRNALAASAYDYPLVLVKSADYWGVGNYRELTAVPAASSSFTYLLMHEFGHFLGLNEEYEGGGRTELEFAPNINEPWSQNITFNPVRETLKWSDLVDEDTPLPTARSHWRNAESGPWGAYRGGYADSSAGESSSYKPGYSCMMSSGSSFCPICTQAIAERLQLDSGEASDDRQLHSP